MADKKAVAFREWLEEVGGVEEKLPDKSFMEHELRKTGAGSHVVVIDKPGEVSKPAELRPKPKKKREGYTIHQLVRDNGGIRAYSDKALNEELYGSDGREGLPLGFRNKEGLFADEMLGIAKRQGMLPGDAEISDLVEALQGRDMSAEEYVIEEEGIQAAKDERIDAEIERVEQEGETLVAQTAGYEEPPFDFDPEADLDSPALRELYPEGEASPYEKGIPEDLKPRKGIIEDLFEATKIVRAAARRKRLRPGFLGSFNYNKIKMGDIRWTRTLAHELGHALDYRMHGDSFPSQIRKRFPDIDVKERALRTQLKEASEYIRPGVDWGNRSSATKYRAGHKELMADFISLYLLDPAKAESIAPELTQALRETIEADATVREAVDLVVNPSEIKPKKSSLKEQLSDPIERQQEPRSEPDPELRATGYAAANRALRTKEAHLSRAFENGRRWRKITTKKERRDIVFHMEKTGDPDIPGDTHAALLRRLSPEAKRIAREIAYQWELNRQEANKLFEEAGSGLEFLKFQENYVAHMWQVPRRKALAFLGRWRKNTPHSKKRSIPTYAEGIEAGLTPKTLDAVFLYEMSAENNFTAAVTRQFAKDLKGMQTATGTPATAPSLAKSGPDWVKIEHPTLRRTYARKSKDGKLILGEGHVYVHPSLARPVKVLLDSRYTGFMAAAIHAVNSAAKSINVAFSAFHEIALYESANASLAKGLNPIRGIFIGPFESKKLGGKFRPRPTHKVGHEIEADYIDAYGISDAADHGLALRRSASADYARGFMSKVLRDLENWSKRVPLGQHVVGNIRKLYDLYQGHLWDNVHIGQKLFTYHTLAAEILPDLPPGVSVKEAKETIATFVNDAFGGQEHLGLPSVEKGHKALAEPATIKMQQIAHALVFAPDWTVSNIRIAGRSAWNQRPGGNKVYRRLGRRYWRNMVGTLAGTAIAFQAGIYALFGDDDEDLAQFPWENEKGHEWDIDVTPLRRGIQNALGMEEQEHRSYIKFGKQAREVLRYFEDFPNGLSRNLGSKSSVIVRLAVEQITGHSAGSGFPSDWARNDLEGWDQIVARARATGENFRPFSFSSTNFAFMLPMSKGMTNYKAGRHYRDAMERWADPSWWEKRVKGNDADREREAIIDIFREIDDAAAANGISDKKRKRLFIGANSSLRSDYYYRFFKALKKKDMKEAEKLATVIYNLGGSWDTVTKSAKGREISSELRKDAGSAWRAKYRYRKPITWGEIQRRD